jgi:hypothetical protein
MLISLLQYYDEQVIRCVTGAPSMAAFAQAQAQAKQAQQQQYNIAADNGSSSEAQHSNLRLFVCTRRTVRTQAA